jgi:hypothetical protein
VQHPAAPKNEKEFKGRISQVAHLAQRKRGKQRRAAAEAGAEATTATATVAAACIIWSKICQD